MRILFLSRWYPSPPDNGSKIRVSNLMRGLCERHSVTLISFFNPSEAASCHDFPGPDEILTCPYREFEPHSPRALVGYLSSTPRFLVDTYHPEMETLIRRAVQTASYDLVIASQLSMASYYRSFRGLPAILEEVELGNFWPRADQWAKPWTTLRQRLTWLKHRRFMVRLLRNFRLCTVASEVERKMFAAAVPGFQDVYVIPNTVDLSQYQPIPNGRARGSLIFAGSLRYLPNHDAMMWFLREVYPAIKTTMPDVRLTITGDPGPRFLPDSSNIRLTGKVADIHSLVAESTVSLAPIRLGGGTRLKILESIALRTPVVSTSKGVEGLEARNGEHLLIADTPREFGEAVLRLLREPDYARNITENALNWLRTRYDWRAVLPRFMDLVDEAATRPVLAQAN